MLKMLLEPSPKYPNNFIIPSRGILRPKRFMEYGWLTKYILRFESASIPILHDYIILIFITLMMNSFLQTSSQYYINEYLTCNKYQVHCTTKQSCFINIEYQSSFTICFKYSILSSIIMLSFDCLKFHSLVWIVTY